MVTKTVSKKTASKKVAAKKAASRAAAPTAAAKKASLMPSLDDLGKLVGKLKLPGTEGAWGDLRAVNSSPCRGSARWACTAEAKPRVGSARMERRECMAFGVKIWICARRCYPACTSSSVRCEASVIR